MPGLTGVCLIHVKAKRIAKAPNRRWKEGSAMVKLRSVTRADSDDLRARVHFCEENGQIWLHEHRMLLVHAEAQASLRKELIDTLGIDRARGVLLRMGYASGLRLHALEGIVRVTPIRLDIDRKSSRFAGELLWENSWEGAWHKRDFGIHTEPVCWTQIG